MKSLIYFVGKLCSIFVRPTNRNFKEENPETFVKQNYFYYLGVVEAVDNLGMLVTQPQSGLKSFFFLNHIVMISEEEVLDPQKEEDAAYINQMKEQNEEIRSAWEEYADKSDLVDIDRLSNLIKKDV